MRVKPVPEAAAYRIDLGKRVFHVVAVDHAGTVIQRAKFSRDTLHAFFAAAPKSLIGMEACAGSQWMARTLIADCITNMSGFDSPTGTAVVDQRSMSL